jgi:hypothetical protein
MVTGLSGLLLAAILSSFLFMGRSSVSIANYATMTSESRAGLEIFGRDIRSGENVKSGFTSTSVTILVPRTSGGVDEIVYTFRPNQPNRPFVRIDSTGERVLMTGIETLQLNYFNLQGAPANVPLEVKQVQLQLKLVRRAISLENTEKIVSARFILRNKEVAK